MALNPTGRANVEIALKIIAGQISKIEGIPEKQRYFLRNTRRQELKDMAMLRTFRSDREVRSGEVAPPILSQPT